MGRDHLPRRWRAAASPGGLIGALGLTLCLLLAAAAILSLSGQADLLGWQPLRWTVLVLALLGATALAFLVYGYATIAYDLGPDALVIRWARQQHVVPLEAVQEVAPATELLGDDLGGWRPFWTGYYIFNLESAVGRVRVVATLPRRRQLLILTADGGYAISPERAIRFVEEYARLRGSFDPDRPASSVLVRPREQVARLARAGWTGALPAVDPAAVANGADETAAGSATVDSDRVTLFGDSVVLLLLALAVVLNVAMVAFILARYASLPPSIALHWNVNGFPDVIGSPREIWTVPIIAGLVTLANVGLAWTATAFDRFAARLLVAGSVLVQIVAWAGLLTLVP